MKKRGQETGANAAALVSIILGMIILYILFLPAEERQELLGDEDENGDTTTSIAGENETILEEFIGRLDYFAQDDYEKDIPNIYLSETSEATILKSSNPFIIRNGWFDKETKNITFAIENIRDTDNILLTLSAKKRKGELTIELNGELIYQYIIDKYDIAPITLDKELLKDGINTLKLSVDGVGWKFWKTNLYSLENIQITADLLDIATRESGTIFSLTGTEYYNLEDSNIRFIPYCTGVRDVGPIDVFINNKEVFSAAPICDDVYDFEFPINLLNGGTNRITFRTHSGSYSVEQIKVYGDLKESRIITHYFEVNQSVVDDIEDNDLEAWLYVDFIDDDEIKEADIIVNGHKTNIDQYKDEYSRDISSWVEEGNNYITIDPQSTLEIVEMRVVLEEQ